ncbi:Sulfoquinovosyl transferase SQD2 [Zea mays]|uniref:Sulfoquinovosyl transferase SQD2 n=1 Tax=Zea mays TaxID=4577 RepID=A0A3L6DXY2_MAIZE|nr:Sulfoquinovosyl transferase SQD2 [Zea mays]
MAAAVLAPKPPPSLPTRAFPSSSPSRFAPAFISPRHPLRRLLLRPIPCASSPSSVLMPNPDLETEPAHDGDGDGDEAPPESRPRRIALFVEPSPFAYVSGYKNRFQNFIKYLREMGDEVIVVTTHEGVPQEFHGAKLIGSWSFPCPWYQKVPLSLALSPRIIAEVARFKPDIIHASSPGIMVGIWRAYHSKVALRPSGNVIPHPRSNVSFDCCSHIHILLFASIHVPLSAVLHKNSLWNHNHILVFFTCTAGWRTDPFDHGSYIPRYTFSWLVKPMWLIIKFLHRAADLTLVPSVAIGRDLQAARVTAANKIRLWNKGVDSESFHPRFRNMEMRSRLTVMDRLPGARIAFIGDGPFRAELEQMFSGMPVVFTGTLQGEELSQAYASGDVFVMPSESETLGFVVLEAMSSGVPVVGARAGGIPDIIPEDQEGRTSFLYTPGDVDDCVGKIKRLLSSEELREAMGRAARKEMEKFDWRAATRKIRNEQYSAAIWFWRKKRAQVLRPLQWVLRLLRRTMPGAADAAAKQS